MAKAFRAGSVSSQFHADVAIDCIIILFSGGAASDDRDSSTKGGDAIDSPVNPEVIHLWLVFPFRQLVVNLYFLVFGFSYSHVV